MHVQINPGADMEISEAFKEHIHKSLGKVEKRFGDRITRIEAFFKDVNGPKGGIDKQCVFEARLRNLDPEAATGLEADAYDAVKVAAERLEKVLERRIGRLAEH